MDRKTALRRLVNNQGFGLEIGPSHSPVFSRADGFNVEILDHLETESLRGKYQALGVDTSLIEDVDYVSDGRPLHEIIPRRGEYDYVFSSHAIEHVTDVIAYFQSCELLLKPDGIAALAVPDKRYTFDFMHPNSTTGQALEAHHRSTGRHSLSAIYDFNANFCTLDGKSVWTKADQGTFAFINSPQVAGSLFESATAPDSAYQDVHGWYFTPNSFRLLLHDMREIGLTNLREIYMMEHGALEFHVALSRDHIGNGLDRVQIHKNIIAEQVASGLQALAADDPRSAAMLAFATDYDAAAALPVPPAQPAPAPTPAPRPTFLQRLKGKSLPLSVR